MTITEIKKVYFELEEAVQKAAEQNWNRDDRIGLTEGITFEADSTIYLDEARHLLETTGENYLPEHPDFEHICVKDWKDPAEDWDNKKLGASLEHAERVDDSVVKEMNESLGIKPKK